MDWRKLSRTRVTRRQAWASAGLCLAGRQRSSGADGLFRAGSINHLALTVPDAGKSAGFYARVLGMRVIQDMGQRGRMLGLRRNYLALFQGEKPGLNHFSPAVDGLDEAAAGAILDQHGYRPFERAPGIWACLDPDGNQTHLSETGRRDGEVDAAYRRNPEPDSLLRAVDVNHVALRVSDLERSVEWYRALMGVNVIQRTRTNAFLGLGENFLALFQRQPGGGADHFCFSIEDYEPDAVAAKLAAVDIRATRHEDRLYFPDPDGLTVQVAAEGHQP